MNNIDRTRSSTVSEVEEHNRAVRQRGADRACYRKSCARCRKPGPFARHELRRRGLRLVVNHSVLCLTVWLARWRCRKCRYVFTDTPSFVLPYKRYAGPTLLDLARTYVEHDRQSYRKTASPGGRVTGYQTPADASVIDERALHHTTVWRMLTWLGCQMVALTLGRQLLHERDPASLCHRFVGAVAPHKFRSPERGQRLRQSRQLLQLIAEWDALFPEKFFPRFATRSGFS